MIRINLLGTPKPKNKRSRVAISAPAMELGEVGSPAMKILVALGLLGVGNGWDWYHLNGQATAIAGNMGAAEQQNRELGGGKAQYLERQKEADNQRPRGDVLD